MQFTRLCRVVGRLPGVGRLRLTFTAVPGPEAPGGGLASNVVVMSTTAGEVDVLLLPGLWRIVGLPAEVEVFVPQAARADLAACTRMRE